MNRRRLFTSFVEDNSSEGTMTFKPHPASPGVALFTNAVLRTQDNKQVKFYDDLIKGRQVIINMMYATCEGACPTVIAKMVKVHEALKDRMGKDLFMYSITLKPEEDDVAAMKSFAEMHEAYGLPGWSFLTGDPYDIETIRYRLFKWDHINLDLNLDIHASMLRVLNDGTNRWLTVNPHASMFTILQEISWTAPNHPMTEAERKERARQQQEKIDREVKKYGYRRST